MAEHWTWNEQGQLTSVLTFDTGAHPLRWTVTPAKTWKPGPSAPRGGRYRFEAAQLSVPPGVEPISADALGELAAIACTAVRHLPGLRIAVGPKIPHGPLDGYSCGLWCGAPQWCVMLALACETGSENGLIHALGHELWHASHHLLSDADREAATRHGDRVRAVKPAGWWQVLGHGGEAEAETFACVYSGRSWPGGIEPDHDARRVFWEHLR